MWGQGCFPKVGYKKRWPQRCTAGRKKPLLPLVALLTFVGFSLLFVSFLFLVSPLVLRDNDSNVCLSCRANKALMCGFLGGFDLGLLGLPRPVETKMKRTHMCFRRGMSGEKYM